MNQGSVYSGRVVRRSKPQPSASGMATGTPQATPEPAPQEAAKAQAEHILAQARQQAQDEARAMMERAQDEARAQAEEILADARTEAARRVLEMTEGARRDLHVSQAAIAEIVLQSMRRILGGFDQAELVRRTVKAGISELRDARRITVRVHEDSYSEIRYALWKSDVGFSGVIHDVEVDNRLDPGQLLLDTGSASIDVGLESQLTVLREHLAPEFVQAERELASEPEFFEPAERETL